MIMSLIDVLTIFFLVVSLIVAVTTLTAYGLLRYINDLLRDMTKQAVDATASPRMEPMGPPEPETLFRRLWYRHTHSDGFLS